MALNTKDIFDFYDLRMLCHINSVNYFAGLFGRQFPEHDNDKFSDSMRNGYAYVFYNTYYKNFDISDEQIIACNAVKYQHHKNATHHIEHYDMVSDIPDTCLCEILCDCAATNFEFLRIIQQPGTLPLTEWFQQNMLQLPWNQKQMDIINKSLDILDKNSNFDTVTEIWQTLLAKLNS